MLADLFDDPSDILAPHILAQPLATWQASSRRFAAFVTTFRDKIRKKLRAAQDNDSLLDLRLELETAYLLLQDKSLSLVYEPQQIGKVRGPDFAVTYTTSVTFMLEVTRLRPGANAASSTLADRVADAMGDKLGQLSPQSGNVLLVVLAVLSELA